MLNNANNQSLPAAPASTPIAPALVQEAASQMNAPATPQSGVPPLPKKAHTGSKIVLGIILMIVLFLLGMGGYYLYSLYAQKPQAQAPVTSVPEPTKAAVTPSVKTEQEEVDAIDTSFPETDVTAIQTDVKRL